MTDYYYHFNTGWECSTSAVAISYHISLAHQYSQTWPTQCRTADHNTAHVAEI